MLYISSFYISAMPNGYRRLFSLKRLYKITHFSVPQFTGLKWWLSGEV